MKQLQQVVSDLHKTTLADEEEEFPGSALRVPPPQTPPPPVQALMMLDRLAHAMEEEYTVRVCICPVVGRLVVATELAGASCVTLLCVCGRAETVRQCID